MVRGKATVPLFLAHVFATDFARGAARVVLAWSVLLAHGGAALGLVVLTVSLGQFFGAMIAGHVTDRHSRRSIAVITSLVGGAGFLAMAAVLTAQGALYLVAALAFATYFVLAIHDNAARTFIPQIADADNLRRVNGHFVTIGEVGFFVAPLVAGWLLERASGGAGLTLAAAFCGAAALLMGVLGTTGAAAIAEPTEAPPEKVSPLFYLQTPWLMTGLALAVLANLFIIPIASVLIPLRVNEVGFGAMELGYFYAALSAGFATAGLITMPRPSWISQSVRLALYLSAGACAYLLTYFFDLMPIILVCGFLAGALLAVFEVDWNSVIQERTSPGIVGRVYATSSWLSFGGRATGVALVGWAVGGLGAQNTIAVCLAALLIGAPLVLLAGRALRQGGGSEARLNT